MRNWAPVQTVEYETLLPVSPEAVLQWHQQAGAFAWLAPPWQTMEITEPLLRLAVGQQTTFQAALAPGVWVVWRAEISGLNTEPEQGVLYFEDTQRQGPFAYWVHRHEFHRQADGTTRLLDKITYGLPGGLMGYWLEQWVHGALVRNKLDQLFRLRTERLQHTFALAHQYAESEKTRPAHPANEQDSYGYFAFSPSTVAGENGVTGASPMKVLISGGTGLVGHALCDYLSAAGHTPMVLSRHPKPESGPGSEYGRVVWSPSQGELNPADVEGFDAIVHLAGENIANGLWTKPMKARLWNSRVKGTTLLANVVSQLKNPPKVFISASAVGYYGSREDNWLTEESIPGDGFLPELCKAWESAAMPIADAGVRLVNARFGIVMSTQDGMLSRLVLPFSLGMGGILGDGQQYISWIDLDDAVAALYHLILNEAIVGPVNMTAPNPVTNEVFSKTLAKTLDRPMLAPPAPAFALRLMLGDMAEGLLLASARVEPRQLNTHNFQFRYETLEQCFKHQLGKA